MYHSELFIVILLILTCKISGENHELIYNDDIVYYDECRVTVSPRNYLQPVRAYVQIQKPCNGTLLWTYPNLQLTLTIVNLENDSFTLCFEKKPLDEKLIRSIKSFNLNTNQTTDLSEMTTHLSLLLCTKSNENRLATIIEAEPLYGGVYLRYAMFNERHPWTSGPFPGWERSEKYLYGPPEFIPIKQKKIRRNRKKIH